MSTPEPPIRLSMPVKMVLPSVPELPPVIAHVFGWPGLVGATRTARAAGSARAQTNCRSRAAQSYPLVAAQPLSVVVVTEFKCTVKLVACAVL